MPGQARHGDGYSAVSQPPFLRKQETGNTQYHACESRNPVIPNTIPAKAGILPYHSCESRNPPNTIPAKTGIQWMPGQARHGDGYSDVSQPPFLRKQESGNTQYHACENRNPPIPFLRKQESNGCRVKPGMVTGTATYHNHHSCENRNPVIPNTMHAKTGIPPYHSCENRNPMDAGSSPAW